MYIEINTRLLSAIFTILLMTPVVSPTAMADPINFERSETEYTGETPVHPGYPRLFDNVGRIDRLADSEAVIDDSLYSLSPTATFHTPRQRSASQSRFREGDLVGCLTNENGEIESIWLISRNTR